MSCQSQKNWNQIQYHMSSVACSIDSNCLLAHYSLKRITWGLKANPIKKKKKKLVRLSQYINIFYQRNVISMTHLIMVGKWYNWSISSQYQGWMNLIMRVCIRSSLLWTKLCIYKFLKQICVNQIFSKLKITSHDNRFSTNQYHFIHIDCHANHYGFFFLWINIFYKPFF